MKKCILCLPLTILSEIKAGFVLTPFVVSMLSRLTSVSSVCCINLTGLRYEGLETYEIYRRFESFQKLLGRLGILIDYYWVDNNTNHINRLQGYCENLVATGKLQSRQVSTLVCQCGAVEVVSEALHEDWLMDYKVLRWEKGCVFCTLCNMSLETKTEHCLMLESCFEEGALAIFPSFYTNEVKELYRKFTQPLLISRQKKGGHLVSLFGKKWQLDTDFCWSLLFCSLIEDGFNPLAVVVSNRSLKPIVWSLGISRKLYDSSQNIVAIITPFVRFDSSNKPRQLGASTLQQLIDRYGRLPIRLLLARGLKWNHKEAIVNSDTIFWALKALSCEYTTILNNSKTALSLSEALHIMDGSFVEQLIIGLRRKDIIKSSQYQDLIFERRI